MARLIQSTMATDVVETAWVNYCQNSRSWRMTGGHPEVAQGIQAQQDAKYCQIKSGMKSGHCQKSARTRQGVVVLLDVQCEWSSGRDATSTEVSREHDVTCLEFDRC